MKLVLFSHKLFRQTPTGLQTDGALTIQVDALADFFDELLLCVPVVNDATFQGVAPTAVNVSFYPLPYYQGRVGFLQTIPALWNGILAAMSQADIGLVILPGYFGAFASWLCQRHGFPLFQWVVGNWGQNVSVQRPDGLIKSLTALWTPLLDWTIKYLTQNTLTFFNGRILYHPSSQPNHHTRVSSSIRMADIFEGKRPEPQRPYHVLYVGRLSVEKGVVYLLRAIANLRSAGEDVILHIVGDGEQMDTLKQETAVLSVQDRIQFHGFVPQGEALRRLYQQSDVFVLPSLQDQQPKVLMEAMAQGVPIIATYAGGIPTVIQDGENGLLVPAAQPEAVAAAIKRLMTDRELRDHLTRQGITYVCERTVDIETKKMMQIVFDHFNFTGGQDETIP